MFRKGILTQLFYYLIFLFLDINDTKVNFGQRKT